MKKSLFVLVLLTATSLFSGEETPVARTRLFPETVIATQTQLYPWREQARGYLGRYANQPLLVDPDLPDDPDRTDIPEFPNWGNFHSQADYDRTLELAQAAGIDGLALFVRAPRFLRACAESPVKGMYTFPIMGTGAKQGVAEFVAYCRRMLDNPCAYRIGDKMPMISYWTSKFFTPAEFKAACDAARKELGDRFIFFASMPVLAREWVRFEENGRQFVPGAREELKDVVRSYLEVADGIQLSEAHMLAKVEGGERVFACEYWDAIHRLTVEVMNEPVFAGKKYLASAAVNSHMNFYKGSHEVCENGTRSLRDSFEVALKYNPDYVQLPEWDEFNENTCFEPTLYCSYAVTRIVRYYSALAKGRPLTVREGDDTTLPNLIVSYRKSLAPGERLMVEVLNVPDGARSGELSVRIELADPEGFVLKAFDSQTLDESRLAEVRFVADTAALAPKARALRVRLVWTKAGRDVRIDEGFHLVDLAPANAWNHLCCKQPVRDLVRPNKADLAFDGRRFKASFACGMPIRYAMLCGNGCIQAVIGKPGSAPHLFREDETHAVFQITAHRLGTDVGNREKPCTLSVKGVPGAEWLYMKRYAKGETFSFGKHRGDGKSASYYVRLPKSALEGAVLEADFPNAWTGRVDLATAFREGTFATGDSGGVMQFTVTRFGLQGRYPSVANTTDVAFDVPVDRNRSSMVYHAQLVMMDGRTWFSRPFVAEPASTPVKTRVWNVVTEKMTDVTLPSARVPAFACDFSPRAGNAVLVSTGERHWTGMLGGPFTPATLWNRGCLTEGVTVWSKGQQKDRLRSGVPGRVQEPDGSWSLVFDGEDDYVAFPIETLPAGAAFSVEMDVWPEARSDGKPGSLLSSRTGLSNFGLDAKGNFVAQYKNLDFKTAKGSFRAKAEFGQWSHVKLVCTGTELVLSVNGKAAKKRIAAKMPAYGSMSLSVGGSLHPGYEFGFFKGKIRNLRFSQACEMEELLSGKKKGRKKQ